jgi:hypothetical protein
MNLLIFFCFDKIPHFSWVVMNYQELLPFNYFELECLLYKVGGHINLPLSVRPSVCPSGYRCMVCSAISSYNFGATALIFCRMFIHIMEVCTCPQDFDFHQIFSKWQVVGLSHLVRPSRYRCMVCSAISSYNFGATALIFCMMFIHIMEVCMSTGFWFSSNIW